MSILEGFELQLLTALCSRILRDAQLEDIEFDSERKEEQGMIDEMRSALESLPGKLAEIVAEELGNVDGHFYKYQETIRNLWGPLIHDFRQSLQKNTFMDNDEVSPSV